MALQQRSIAQNLHCLLLGKHIDIIGVLHFIVKSDDVSAGKCHTQTDACSSPRLGERSKDNKVGIFLNIETERFLRREVAVCLIHNHNALKSLNDFLYLLTRKSIARRIVWWTDENDFSVLVTRCQKRIGIHVIILIQRHLTVLHIVHISTHLIHTISGVNSHHIIFTRTAEDAIRQINRLITTITQEDILHRHSLHRWDYLFQLLLQRIWVAVHAIRIRILVGIEESISLHPLKLVTGTTIWFKRPYVGTH